MISLKPRSILQLTVTGFLAVTALLVIALVITARQLDGLSERSQQIISQSATAMTASRTLIQQATAMERNARQYNIVGDPEILKVYADRRQSFAEAAQQLSALNLSTKMTDLLNALVRNEALAFTVLTSGRPGRALPDNALAASPALPGSDNTLYPQLLESAYSISDLINAWTRTQLADLREEAQETRNMLTIQALTLIGAALLLAGVFTALITRPLVQIERAINRLGGGQYDSPIRITGPRDLMSLGGHLDWLRSRLGKLERQRSSFFRHVSHEFKTPLAALQESTALLKDGVVGPLNDEQKEILRIQSSNCQRLQTLIDDLLRYHRESFSVLNTMPQAVRFDRVVESVASAHELLIKSERLQLKCHLDKLTVQGNPEQLRVVVDNLLTNAIKFSPGEGIIALDLHQEADEAVLDVRDQGPGVPRNESEKVFDAFYQGKPAGKPFLKGSGLGLSIAQEYVNANGGRIRVKESAGGAHFEVRFPLPGKDAA